MSFFLVITCFSLQRSFWKWEHYIALCLAVDGAAGRQEEGSYQKETLSSFMAGDSSIFPDLFSLIYIKLPYLMKKSEVNFEKLPLYFHFTHEKSLVSIQSTKCHGTSGTINAFIFFHFNLPVLNSSAFAKCLLFFIFQSWPFMKLSWKNS